MGDTKLKIAILTGDELRHRYYANTLTHEFEVVLVAHEKKANVHEKAKVCLCVCTVTKPWPV